MTVVLSNLFSPLRHLIFHPSFNYYCATIVRGKWFHKHFYNIYTNGYIFESAWRFLLEWYQYFMPPEQARRHTPPANIVLTLGFISILFCYSNIVTLWLKAVGYWSETLSAPVALYHG